MFAIDVGVAFSLIETGIIFFEIVFFAYFPFTYVKVCVFKFNLLQNAI